MIKDNLKNFIINKAKSEDFPKHPFFYLYDLNDVHFKLDIIKRYASSNVSVYYAMKANNHVEILNDIKKDSDIKGVEIASVGELEIAQNFFNPSQIIYTGPGKTLYELEQSLLSKIRFLSVESITEAYRINDLATKLNLSKVNILVRINPNYVIRNSLKKMGGSSSKMGIDEDTIISSLKKINKLNLINVIGFHVFAASGILLYSDLLDYVDYIFNLISKIEKYFDKRYDIVDFGGGIGVDYSGKGNIFDIKSFFENLAKLVNLYGFKDKELVLELGRFIIAESGYYITQIVDIKESKGKKHIILSGGTNHVRLIRKHPIYVIPLNAREMYRGQPSVRNEFVQIEGPLCFGEDYIDEDIFIARAEIGDLAVISHVGAYGYNVASLEFLCHAKPYQYIYDLGE